MASNNGNGNGNGNGEHEESLHDMPELDVRAEEKVETGGYRGGGGQGKAIYTKTGNRHLSSQILSPPGTAEEAAAWTSLNFKNIEEVKKVHAIMDAWAHCEEFHIQCGIDEIRRYLILLPAAGGWGRALAAMIETGIIVPSGLGVSKNAEEEVKRAVKRKEEEDADRRKD
jgi:hypothetical protein